MAEVSVAINGRSYVRAVADRLLLVDFLRHELGLTGTHVGCEQGVCGSCTVLVDGAAVRSCLILAAQADGSTIATVEGLSNGPELHPLQQAFREHFALQCGFCTPGMIASARVLLQRKPVPTVADIRKELGGNICRCTGYVKIVDAVLAASKTAVS